MHPSQKKIDTVLTGLETVKTLMELKGENPFKTRAFDRGIESLRQAASDPDGLALLFSTRKLTDLAGIGKGISEVAYEYWSTGKSSVAEEIERELPAGLLELIQVPGLGPKKANTLIESLQIRSLKELEYACAENRLLELKGFGEKVQKKILEGVQFILSQAGQKLLPEARAEAEEILTAIRKKFPKIRMEWSGLLHREREIVDGLLLLVEGTGTGVATWTEQEFAEHKGLSLTVREVPAPDFGRIWVETSSDSEFWNKLPAATRDKVVASDESEFFQKLGLPYFPPEVRESAWHFEQIEKDPSIVERLVKREDIRHLLHVHTTESDGSDSLEVMRDAANKGGFESLGVSDHSGSAFYAQGLKSDRLLQQLEKIHALDLKPGPKLLAGTESDILQDGGLDFSSEVLEKLDFVIGSVHSRFQMDRDAMTGRLVAAVAHPNTSILGHPSGRILLGRKPYDFDEEKVYAAAVKNGVAIELNAHPSRLDFDWRKAPLLKKLGAKIAVNPDAHETAGYRDLEYGVLMARKGLFTREEVINTWELPRLRKFLKKK